MAVFCLLVLLGCGGAGQYAGGKEDEVFVVADLHVWKELGPHLERCLEQDIRVVHEEQVFYLERIDPETVPEFRWRKNLLVVGTISGQRTSPLIAQHLSPESLESAREKGASIFAVDSPYRREQVAIVVTGTSSKAIREVLETSCDVLFETFFDRVKERIKARVTSDVNTRLTREIQTEYGWTLTFPKHYRLSREEGKMVSFVQHFPDRIISVYWEQEEGPGDCLQKREDFGRTYLDGDFILREKTKVEDVEIEGHTVTRIEGVWQNEKHVMGGAFITHCIHLPEQKMGFLIDGLLFAPGKKKWMHMAELEAIVESFRME